MGAARLALPLAFAPEPVRAHGLRAAHVYPLVGRKTGARQDLLVWPRSRFAGLVFSLHRSR